MKHYPAVFFIALCLLLTGCASSPRQSMVNELANDNKVKDKTVYARMPWVLPVAIHGHLDFGKMASPGGNNVVYQDVGLGGAGIAAQLIGHALVANSAEKKRINKATEEADQILKPIMGQVRKLYHGELWKALRNNKDLPVKELKPFTDANIGQGDWILDFTPTFYLSQDKRALLLVNQIGLAVEGDESKPSFHNKFIVTSDPITATDIDSFWAKEEEEPLKVLALELFKESITLAALSMRGRVNADSNQRTQRYHFGNDIKFERGNVISEVCSRVVIKNLRGHIMSVPTAKAPNC